MEEKKPDSIVIKEYFIDITKEGSLKAGKDDVFQNTTRDDSINADTVKNLPGIPKAVSLEVKNDELTKTEHKNDSIYNNKFYIILMAIFILLAASVFFYLSYFFR